jgi:hypothetical protein
MFRFFRYALGDLQPHEWCQVSGERMPATGTCEPLQDREIKARQRRVADLSIS